jgi:hypothetical protein
MNIKQNYKFKKVHENDKLVKMHHWIEMFSLKIHKIKNWSGRQMLFQ